MKEPRFMPWLIYCRPRKRLRNNLGFLARTSWVVEERLGTGVIRYRKPTPQASQPAALSPSRA
jgi:hypothetical protein